MSDREIIENRVTINGRPFTVALVHNPLIDDVVIAGMKVAAYEVINGSIDPSARVPKDIRDFLIRLGVER